MKLLINGRKSMHGIPLLPTATHKHIPVMPPEYPSPHSTASIIHLMKSTAMLVRSASYETYRIIGKNI
jgi:hypothetical protein